MKAERRHELQTNSLAAALQNFPQLMQQYGSRILLAITLIVLLIVLLQYRARTVEQHALALQQQLSSARAAIAEIRQSQSRLPLDRLVAHRQQLATEAETAINDVLENTDSRQMRAEALLARGDLHWALATAPSPATTQAATQPSMTSPRTPQDLYRSAQAAYEQIINEYPDQTRTQVAALFGLAAIAENQHDWDAAAQRYRAIIESTDLPMYRELAEQRARALDRLREPLYIGQAATLPAFDAEEPADAPLPPGVAAPVEAPATQPAPAAEAPAAPASPQPAPAAPAPTEPAPTEPAPAPADPAPVQDTPATP